SRTVMRSVSTSSDQSGQAANGLVTNGQGSGHDCTSWLHDVRVALTDLPDDLLGLAMSDEVLIDRDAARRGWFVDPTPDSDGEFSASGRAFNSEAARRVDLLTVVLHELGHMIGLEHTDAAPNSLMQETLGLGIRRLPTSDLADDYFAQA